MSLSPIIGAASQVLSLFSSSSTANSSSSASSTDPLSIIDSSGKVDLSQAAQLFSKLQDISQTNPAQFKQLTAQISTQLQAEAQKATGSAETFLSNLASQFNNASQTGSASDLQPQQTQTGSHHHGHHHHSSSQAAYELSNQTSDAQSTATGAVQSIFQQLQNL